VLGHINEVKLELRRSKVMIVGEGRAGKTAFANSIIGKKFEEETESTIGINTFMCSVHHAALNRSEWIKCDKIEKEYENAIAEHLSIVNEVGRDAEKEPIQIINEDRNVLSNRMTGKYQNDESIIFAVDHSKADKIEYLVADNIDQSSSNTKVDEDMIVKYLASHIEIGANILISIFDYGGQTVFNVSTMFVLFTLYFIC